MSSRPPLTSTALAADLTGPAGLSPSQRRGTSPEATSVTELRAEGGDEEDREDRGAGCDEADSEEQEREDL